jgi:hypothetical protein
MNVMVMMNFVGTSARDRNGKPGVERLAERGLVVDSPLALRLAWPGRQKITVTKNKT